MRARIDISEIEAETKIRAKYLRALENEEWGLLPGPAYVRSFLRTYAEALDLDAKLLLEEYKLRHERPSDHDLMPIGAPRRRGGQRYDRPPRRVPRSLIVGVVLVALLAALYLLGQFGNDDGDGDTATTTPTSTTTTTATPARTTRASGTSDDTGTKPAAPTPARLQVVPTGPVYVCLRDAGGRLRINGQTLQPGASSAVFRSRRFTILLGNGSVRLRVNGRLRDVADASPVAYRVTRTTFQRIDPTQAPSCEG